MRRYFLWWLLFIPLSAIAAPHIVVYGDSLSAGYGLPPGADWVSLLRQRLQRQKYNFTVVNASISGETSRGGAYRIERTLRAQRPAIVIVELGGNDGLQGLPLPATRRHLDAIIRACLRRRAQVLLVGMRLPPNYGESYTAPFQALYPALAKRYSIALTPFMLAGFAEDRRLFQADGIHPAAAAQPRILDNLWPALLPLLRNAQRAAN
ncbi:MAG TPA: arylesterase [Betaproteobacteria bacterium]|nr:arylesterase [Betaproteobacteria bacterium]